MCVDVLVSARVYYTDIRLFVCVYSSMCVCLFLSLCPSIYLYLSVEMCVNRRAGKIVFVVCARTLTYT